MLALFLRGKKSLKRSLNLIPFRRIFDFHFLQAMKSKFLRFGFRSRYISRYVNLKFGFLPFLVASIVAMVFFCRICSSRPGDGNSADRAWQLSQLVEGVLTACQPQPRQPVLRRNNLRCCPRCWLFSCLGFEFPTPFFPLKSTKGALRPLFGRSAPSLLFHGALWNILLSAGFPAMFHMITLEQTFVNGPLQNISLADASCVDFPNGG